MGARAAVGVCTEESTQGAAAAAIGAGTGRAANGDTLDLCHALLLDAARGGFIELAAERLFVCGGGADAADGGFCGLEAALEGGAQAGVQLRSTGSSGEGERHGGGYGRRLRSSGLRAVLKQ